MGKIEHHEVETRCPGCGRVNPLHSSTSRDGAAPTVGDVGVCWKCYAVGIFDLSPLGMLIMRAPTAAEEIELGRDEQLARALTAMKTSRSPHRAAERAAAAHDGADR